MFAVQNGKVYLSLLSIVELEPLLTTAYEDSVNICCLCKHLVIQVSTIGQIIYSTFWIGCGHKNKHAGNTGLLCNLMSAVPVCVNVSWIPSIHLILDFFLFLLPGSTYSGT